MKTQDLVLRDGRAVMTDRRGDEWLIPLIPREDLQVLVDKTLVGLGLLDTPGINELAPQVQEVADQAEVIAANRWFIDKSNHGYIEELNGCGCVIGHLRYSRGEGACPDSDNVEWLFGEAFDTRLQVYLWREQGVEGRHDGYVVVID